MTSKSEQGGPLESRFLRLHSRLFDQKLKPVKLCCFLNKIPSKYRQRKLSSGMKNSALLASCCRFDNQTGDVVEENFLLSLWTIYFGAEKMPIWLKKVLQAEHYLTQNGSDLIVKEGNQKQMGKILYRSGIEKPKANTSITKQASFFLFALYQM